MADLPPYRTPRWVKIVGIIALVLVLLVSIMLLTGMGGEHGPGRHLPAGDNGGPAQSSRFIDVRTLPSGHGVPPL